ncbi:MAG: hypothetical protein WD512_12905, partial [Candidatus Paceibacterota bacterium]
SLDFKQREIKPNPNSEHWLRINAFFQNSYKYIYENLFILSLLGLWLSVISGDLFTKTMEAIEQHDKKSQGAALDELHQLYQEIGNQF